MCTPAVADGSSAAAACTRAVRGTLSGMTLNRMDTVGVTRMDNVLIVVDDLEAAKAFFIELGLKLEGETTVEGPLVGSLTRSGFGPVDAPVNTLGIRRVMFAVDHIDAVVARMRAHGAELIVRNAVRGHVPG